ncbi:MAG: ABC transporter ATP-binding protein [Cyanobacteria bacterium K_Offshore_0m_m2_072]|nr:ABC transporter ATP-binding protein [Cyanobacteria bacterium K_Offshore_0m_m2_072]
MARQQRPLRPILELARHLSLGSWLAVALVAGLVLLEAGGLVLAILQLSFWGLLLAGLALVVRRASAAWLLGRMRLELAETLLGQLLQQRYALFLQDDPAAQASRLATSLDRLEDDLLAPALQGLAGVIRLLVISALLVFWGSRQGFQIGLALVLAQVLIAFVAAPYLRFYAAQAARYSSRSSSQLLDVLTEFQDVRLTGSEAFFAGRYRELAQRSRRYRWLHAVLLLLPPALMVVVALVVLVLLVHVGGPTPLPTALPLPGWVVGGLAVLAVVLVLSELFFANLRIRSALPELARLLWIPEVAQLEPSPAAAVVPLLPRQRLRLDAVAFRYPGRQDFALKGLSLVIPVGARVAFVGPSGSGKSTAARVLLGLFEPTAGAVELDGAALAPEDLPRWRASCAQVPQTIALLNGSIQANVAFGCSDDQIDEAAVWQALESALLADDVANLPYGLMTPVGANGVQLSGGQRQRLALARAFYRQASLLVLDEATSALDAPTESSVMEALELVARRCTTVVIAHRLSTVRRCDRIFEFERGRIRASGTYDELLARSPSFAQLVQGEASEERF